MREKMLWLLSLSFILFAGKLTYGEDKDRDRVGQLRAILQEGMLSNSPRVNKQTALINLFKASLPNSDIMKIGKATTMCSVDLGDDGVTVECENAVFDKKVLPVHIAVEKFTGQDKPHIKEFPVALIKFNDNLHRESKNKSDKLRIFIPDANPPDSLKDIIWRDFVTEDDILAAFEAFYDWNKSKAELEPKKVSPKTSEQINNAVHEGF